MTTPEHAPAAITPEEFIARIQEARQMLVEIRMWNTSDNEEHVALRDLKLWQAYEILGGVQYDMRETAASK